MTKEYTIDDFIIQFDNETKTMVTYRKFLDDVTNISEEMKKDLLEILGLDDSFEVYLDKEKLRTKVETNKLDCVLTVTINVIIKLNGKDISKGEKLSLNIINGLPANLRIWT